jgi:hypothetical protein
MDESSWAMAESTLVFAKNWLTAPEGRPLLGGVPGFRPFHIAIH